jgi:hypothetical protein
MVLFANQLIGKLVAYLYPVAVRRLVVAVRRLVVAVRRLEVAVRRLAVVVHRLVVVVHPVGQRKQQVQKTPTVSVTKRHVHAAMEWQRQELVAFTIKPNIV